MPLNGIQILFKCHLSLPGRRSFSHFNRELAHVLTHAVLTIFQNQGVQARVLNGVEKMLRDRMLQHVNLWIKANE